MTNNRKVTLSDGAIMPQLGFGVWQVPDDEAERVVAEALRVGYRSIDTAQMYRNEAGVGRAVAPSGIDRAELFITTKLDNTNHGYDEARAALAESLTRLGLDYVDLFLIHWPLPGQDKYVPSWRAFIDARKDGQVKSVGVSNFTKDFLARLVDETGVTPVLNQVELHPYFQQRDLRAFHAEHGIATEAWSPLGQGKEVLADPVIVRIAEAHGATPAQVIIAWHLAIGNVVIPKSVTPSRIAENFNATEVTLTPADLEAIAGLDRSDGRIGPDPATVGAN